MNSILALLKFKAQSYLPMQQMIGLLQLNLVERRDVLALFSNRLSCNPLNVGSSISS